MVSDLGANIDSKLLLNNDSQTARFAHIIYNFVFSYVYRCHRNAGYSYDRT
jgi:hypothetical protein